MSPNGIYSGFNKIFISSSSDSSDSESLLLEDVKNGENQINKQWEAIERTLYQEPGQQVTDPELLKECKLWRDTFPHFRVRGTKIDITQTENKVVEANKNLEALKNNFNFQKLEEKRESIKKKVVGQLVERIIAKYGFQKEEKVNWEKNGLQMSVIEDGSSEKMFNNANKSIHKNSELSSDNESYYERGKQGDCMTVEQVEKNLYEIFDSWEKDCKADSKFPKKINSQKLSVGKNPGKPIGGKFKPNKFTLPSNSLPNVIKPIEITKKIDKKYDGLIEKIIERKYNELDAIRHCPTSASDLEIKTYEESLNKLRRASGFDDYLKRKEMPKINKFNNNNWLKKSEMNCYSSESDPHSEKSQRTKMQSSSDEMLLELKKEIALNYKRPAKKTGVIEEIKLQRPKPFTVVEKKKSLSSKDSTKKNKVETKGKLQPNGPGSTKNEMNCKKKINSNNLNYSKGRKLNGNPNLLLPPIETSIICKELTGRPKIGSKTPIKRY